MRIRMAAIPVLALLLAACGSDIPNLPGAAAPTSPPPTQPGANDLSPVGPTTFTGTPNGVTVLQVRATRANGKPAYGVVIQFQIQAGGGEMKPIITTTDSDGIASAQWTFGPTASINLASATGGFTTSPVSFTVSTFPDSAATP